MQRRRRMATIHEKIAADIPQGGILECKQCGASEPINDGDVARYLARGWPKHCAYTMRWVTENEMNAKDQH